MSDKMPPSELAISEYNGKIDIAKGFMGHVHIYHHDDKYRALEVENERLRAALTTIKIRSPNDTDVRIASEALERK